MLKVVSYFFGNIGTGTVLQFARYDDDQMPPCANRKRLNPALSRREQMQARCRLAPS